MNKTLLAPSLLSCDFAYLSEAIKKIEKDNGSEPKYEISEDDSDFEALIDDFADSDLVSKIGSKKEKKEITDLIKSLTGKKTC